MRGIGAVRSTHRGKLLPELCGDPSTFVVGEPGRFDPFQGQASDIDIEAREVLRVNDLIRHILAKNTGQDPERIRVDFDRNY